MENMKSLADQLRKELVKPESAKSKSKKKETPKTEYAILQAILAYDSSENNHMVHSRFDAGTLRLMNHFKMATGVDVSKLVAFSVKKLFDTHPDLKKIIKEFMQNTDL